MFPAACSKALNDGTAGTAQNPPGTLPRVHIVHMQYVKSEGLPGLLRGACKCRQQQERRGL